MSKFVFAILFLTFLVRPSDLYAQRQTQHEIGVNLIKGFQYGMKKVVSCKYSVQLYTSYLLMIRQLLGQISITVRMCGLQIFRMRFRKTY